MKKKKGVKKDKLQVKRENFCKICKKTIAGSSYKFKSHLYHQHKTIEARYKCSFCLKEFYRNDLFKAHLKQHTGALKKPTYVCDYCERSFAVKRNLIAHLKIHDDNPYVKYECIACGKSYCEQRLLKYHIRKTHFNLTDKEKSYTNKGVNETWIERVNQTEICVEMTKVNNNTLSIKKFGALKEENSIVKTDERTDEKIKFRKYMSSILASTDSSQYAKATCDYCKKEMLKKSLLAHIREKHLKIKKFKCDECLRLFSRHYQLVDHICGKTRKRKRVLTSHVETKKASLKAKL